MKKIMLLIMLTLMTTQVAYARLELDSISFDPAIIAAGDEVDIVLQFHAENFVEGESRIGNPEWEFKVKLLPDDTLTEKHIIIEDSEGNNVQGTLFSGEYYNRRYRVRVTNDAPPGSYEFKLEGRWYHKGEPEDASQYIRFKMPVKKEGIILGVSNMNTIPSEVRPGDDFVSIETYIENVGQKDAKSVEIQLRLPEGLEASYSNNNRLWVGRLNAGESKKLTFNVDVDEDAVQKVYHLMFDFAYNDLDDNSYRKQVTTPFLVKPRPYLEVIESNGEGRAGSTGKLKVTVKNTGNESAEAVDVRLIKQNPQPFTLDVRSDYIGELEPGEQGVAIFELGVNRDAEIKEHNFKLLIRSKGDSDEGDDNIYTYNRRAKFDVTGTAPNYLLWISLTGFAVAVIVFLVFRRKK